MNLSPCTSPGATPAGSPGRFDAVGTPLMNVPPAQSVVHASTWTRFAPGGKLTASIPTRSTLSKKALSVSLTTIWLSGIVPVFWAWIRTWAVCGGTPGRWRATELGAITFCTAPPADGALTSRRGAHESLDPWPTAVRAEVRWQF